MKNYAAMAIVAATTFAASVSVQASPDVFMDQVKKAREANVQPQATTAVYSAAMRKYPFYRADKRAEKCDHAQVATQEG